MSNKTEVLSFDELARFHGLSLMKWDEDNYASENTQLAKDFFEAGQQSKQAEIDELQNKYEAMYRAFTVADDCRKEWHRCYVGIRQREDDLQKNFNNALKTIDIQQQFLDDTDGTIKIITSQVDELQNRIDDLKSFCIKGVESNMLSIEYNQALIDMHKLLKGEETK